MRNMKKGNNCSVKEKKLQAGNPCKDADVDWAESERKFVETNRVH